MELVVLTMEIVAVELELMAVELELMAVELEIVAVTLLPGWIRMRLQCKVDILVGVELRIEFVMKIGSGILLCV